ncbi:MAG: MmcQ/YjbR family DNA-binding protein [Bacteroidota bacterium]
MDVVHFREYCLEKAHVNESFPFNEHTLVFKVAGKMFALLDLEEGQSANLKCDPERAIELREHYEGVHPGYHMSKKHWNTVYLNSDVGTELLLQLIDHSYESVIQTFSKKKQKTIL